VSNEIKHCGQHGGVGADFVLHPLIHTLLEFDVAQNVEKKKAEPM
jgi:hypothetical protein